MAAKVQQITVKQVIVENSNPVAYEYHMVRLVNRLTPRVGTVLAADAVLTLMADEGVYVTVQ